MLSTTFKVGNLTTFTRWQTNMKMEWYFSHSIFCYLTNRLLPHRSQPMTNHSASSVKRYLRWLFYWVGSDGFNPPPWFSYPISTSMALGIYYQWIFLSNFEYYTYLTLIPFASSLHAGSHCAFREFDETAQERRGSSLISSKGERSNIHVGLQPPHPQAATHFPGLQRMARLVPFYSVADLRPASPRRTRLAVHLDHMTNGHSKRAWMPLCMICIMPLYLYYCILYHKYSFIYGYIAIRPYI